jgi:integrase
MRNKVLLMLGYETMRRRSELCNFRFENLQTLPNGVNADVKLTH